MPSSGIFAVRLVVDGKELPEVEDTLTGQTYAVCSAGQEYKIRLSADGERMVGVIVQVDGVGWRDTIDPARLGLVVPSFL